MIQIKPEIFQEVLSAYDLGEGTITYKAYGEGHINNTSLVTVTGKETHRFILQRINTDIFTNPKSLMENICGVTSYLKDIIAERGGDTERETMTVVYTRDGQPYYTDTTQGAWRIYKFVEHTICLQQCRNTEDFYTSAKAFGQFQKNLSGYDASTLHETIPDFHNTRKRYQKLREDMEADVCGRVAEVREELDWLLSVEDTACKLTDLYTEGKLPLRVTHNDTKINNVLFDEATHKALVVIDLDTVMPGLVGHDFGDAIRFAANFVEEDSPEADKAGVNLNIYWAFAEGFIQKTASTLTETEVDTLGLSCFALACELATRFLDDYIVGDKYFKIKYEKHNLTRTRCQIALAKDMLLKMDAMNAIVKDCWVRYKDK